MIISLRIKKNLLHDSEYGTYRRCLMMLIYAQNIGLYYLTRLNKEMATGVSYATQQSNLLHIIGATKTEESPMK